MSAADCTRVYLEFGRMAHLVPADRLQASVRPLALCRRKPERFAGWLGTRSETEHEQAAGLPTCGKCERAVEASG